MNYKELVNQIKNKRSYLCIGLDTDADKMPAHLNRLPDPVFEFNRQVIDATKHVAVAFKLNTAFYEANGTPGWESLRKTLAYIPPECFTIADAKRGDIGNTSALYAKAFFETMHFDALTVAPYMGEDSVKPFLKFRNKWVILLAHTSNPGSADFQLIESKVTDRRLYEEVILKAKTWATPEQLMFVVGATQTDTMKHIRELAPDHFFLVPGIGAQGGDLEMVSDHGMNRDCGLLVNSSRAVIYASSGSDFAAAAAAEAVKLQQQMAKQLVKHGITQAN